MTVIDLVQALLKGPWPGTARVLVWHGDTMVEVEDVKPSTLTVAGEAVQTVPIAVLVPK